MLGRKAALAMSLVLIAYSYGSATAYLIILGDCFQPMLAGHFGLVWWTQRSLVIAALASAFMLPLCFPRTLHAISGGRAQRGGAAPQARCRWCCWLVPAGPAAAAARGHSIPSLARTPLPRLLQV